MREFYDNCHDTGAIRFRDAFFGGRTSVEWMHAEAEEGYKIKYMDIQSLYPSVNFSTNYPVGQPTCKVYNKKVYWNKSEDMIRFMADHAANLQGIIKCFVVPPKDSNISPAVLPGRFGDERLLFPLCRTCATENKTGRKDPDYFCKHFDDKDRGFVTTMTSGELALAVDNGYEVKHLYRVYSFDKWDVNLFKGYVREFLKLKIEASGWKGDCVDETSRTDFISENLQTYGIDVDPAKMNKNAGLRYIAKVCRFYIIISII
jgi:hypothetical protein